MKAYVVNWAGEPQSIYLRKSDAHRDASYFPEEMKSSLAVVAYTLTPVVDGQE